MKSQVKLYKTDIDDFLFWLSRRKITVNTQVFGWRVLIFKTEKQTEWTQCYDGLTRAKKEPRNYLRVAGKEQNLVTKFYKGYHVN
jgi:hypothetical protein